MIWYGVSLVTTGLILVALYVMLQPRLGVFLAPAPEPAPRAARVRPSCASFPTQGAAQEYFVEHHATWLDGNRNGVACEANPR